MIYFFIFLLFIGLSLYEFYYKEERYVEILIFFFTASASLILFSGFRLIGFDYDNYHLIFDTVNLSNYEENTIEIGFAFLIQIFHFLNLPFNLFLFFIALVSVGIKSIFIKDFSPYYFVSLIVYFTVNFLLSDMGQIRHGLAMGIALFSFYDIFNKNKRGFVIKIIIAYLFHSSAIIVFPAYLIANIKKITVWHLVLPLIALLPLMFIDIKGAFIPIAAYLPAQIQSKIAYYTTSEEFGQQLGFNLTMVFRLVIIATMYYYFEEGVKTIKFYRQFFLLYIYGTILFMAFNSIAEMALRFSNYFKILEFVILPMLITLGKSLLEKHIVLIIIILYAGWSLYKLLFDQYTSIEYLPYRNLLLGN